MSYLTTGRPASTDPTLQSDEQDALEHQRFPGRRRGTGNRGRKCRPEGRPRRGAGAPGSRGRADAGRRQVRLAATIPRLSPADRPPHRSREVGDRARRRGVRGGVRRAAPTSAQPSGRRKRVPHLPPAPAVTVPGLRRWRLGGLLPAACMLLVATGAAAQDSIPFIRPRAQVGSVDFRFQSEQSFSTSELGGVIALKGRGSLYQVRQLLGKLPFIGAPGHPPIRSGRAAKRCGPAPAVL